MNQYINRLVKLIRKLSYCILVNQGFTNIEFKAIFEVTNNFLTMAIQKITSRQYFKTARVIHMALVVGIVLFASVASFSMSGQDMTTGYDSKANMFYILVGFLGLWGLFGGEYIFKIQLKRAKSQPQLTQKMVQYQSANIIKYALIEGVALFSIVAALMTSSVWFLIFAGFLVLVLASYYPSVEKAIRDLELNNDEKKQVNNPDAYISEMMDHRK